MSTTILALAILAAIPIVLTFIFLLRRVNTVYEWLAVWRGNQIAVRMWQTGWLFTGGEQLLINGKPQPRNVPVRPRLRDEFSGLIRTDHSTHSVRAVVYVSPLQPDLPTCEITIDTEECEIVDQKVFNAIGDPARKGLRVSPDVRDRVLQSMIQPD